jgi:hypothetical protein
MKERKRQKRRKVEDGTMIKKLLLPGDVGLSDFFSL